MSEDRIAADSAVAHSPLFSKLSGELRNRVWSLAISGDDVIDIFPTGVTEPGLLTACRFIRKEAGSLYCHDNKLRAVCARYDSNALLIANRKFETFKTSRTRKQGHGITSDRKPSWKNLLIWLERIHAGRLSCPALRDEDGEIDVVVLYGAFKIAAGLRGMSWPKVEALLKRQRALLVKIDSTWAKEPSAEK